MTPDELTKRIVALDREMDALRADLRRYALESSARWDRIDQLAKQLTYALETK